MQRILLLVGMLALSAMLPGCVSDAAGRIPTADEAPSIDAPPAGTGPPEGFGLPEEGR